MSATGQVQPPTSSKTRGVNESEVKAVEAKNYRLQYGSQHALFDQTRYVGVKRRAEVETKLLGPGDFRLYHELPDRAGVEHCKLPLRIMYQTSFGAIKVYQVCNYKQGPGHGHKQYIFYVETGPERPPSFRTLEALCRHYELYGYVTGSFAVEMFPWWQINNLATSEHICVGNAHSKPSPY